MSVFTNNVDYNIQYAGRRLFSNGELRCSSSTSFDKVLNLEDMPKDASPRSSSCEYIPTSVSPPSQFSDNGSCVVQHSISSLALPQVASPLRSYNLPISSRPASSNPPLPRFCPPFDRFLLALILFAIFGVARYPP